MESMAEGMIKDLVASGHALADDMTGAPSVLVRCLAAQLEVQLVRANELAEDHQRAIESIKQADAAVKLAHEKFSALAAENAGIKSAIPEPRDIEDDNDNMDDVSLAEDFGFNHAIERMRKRIPETPATDAFLSEVRAQGVEMFADHLLCPDLDDTIRDFAAQLRKGGNQ